jgi:hypothetical protein
MTQSSFDGPPLVAASSIAGLADSLDWAIARAHAWVQTGTAADVMPSYWAGLTDRPMFYSRDLAHQMLGAHLIGLDAENLSMLQHFAASATERRRWYPLWAFNFDGTPAAIDYHSDDDFVREIPAPFELVEKAVEQYLWTRDERFLRGSSTAGFIGTTMSDFIAAHDPLGSGIAGEPGTGSIFAGTATYNEVERPPHLIVAADGISSQWAAHRALAALDPELLPTAGGIDHASRAAELAAAFESDWWLEAEQHYTSGFTADGPVTGFGLESTWFPAVKGMLSDAARATAHADFLTRSLRTAPPANIEAKTYLPEAYLAVEQDDEALRWILELGASRDDYPEVSYTHIAHVVAGLAGVAPAPDGSIRTRPRIPAGETLTVKGVRVGHSIVDVHHDGRETTELRVVSGPAVMWTPTWDDGPIPSVLVPAASRAVARRSDERANLPEHQ